MVENTPNMARGKRCVAQQFHGNPAIAALWGIHRLSKGHILAGFPAGHSSRSEHFQLSRLSQE